MPDNGPEQRSGLVRLRRDTVIPATQEAARQLSEEIAVARVPEKVRAKALEFIEAWERQAFQVYDKHGLPRAVEGMRPYLIGIRAAAVDTEIGFASAILEKTMMVRSRLQKGDTLDPWQTFIDAASIAQLSEQLYVEFPLSYWIAPARKHRADQQSGAERQALNALSIRAREQRQAEEIWKKHPTWKKSAVAQLVEKNGGRPWNTVRQHIKKPD